MTVHVRALLGDVAEPRYSGRTRDPVVVGHTDATKRRLRLRSAAGTDVVIDLQRGAYLADGAVLDDDGRRVLHVERAAELALVLRFVGDMSRNRLIEAAARIGHVFGNQHVPVDVEGGTIRIPITTSPELATQTVSSLHLNEVEVSVEPVQLGLHHPLAHGHDH